MAGKRAPSLFAESEQSVRDAGRYQRPWPSYLYAGRAAQAFEPGAESSLARGAPHLGASDLHIRLGHIENGDRRYEFSSDEVPGRAWDRQRAHYVRDTRIVRATEYQLHPTLRQFRGANGAVLLKKIGSGLLTRSCAVRRVTNGPSFLAGPPFVVRRSAFVIYFLFTFATAVRVKGAIVLFKRKVCSRCCRL